MHIPVIVVESEPQSEVESPAKSSVESAATVTKNKALADNPGKDDSELDNVC